MRRAKHQLELFAPPTFADVKLTVVIGEPTPTVKSWRDFVYHPSEEWMQRRYLQIWAWDFNPRSHVLLRPALDATGHSTRRAVVAETLQGTTHVRKGLPVDYDTAAKCKTSRGEPHLIFGDDIVTTTMLVHWWDFTSTPGHDTGMRRSELCDVPNAFALRYVTETALVDMFLVRTLEGSIWDYTTEHPDFPCVRQKGPPCLFADLGVPITGEPTVARQHDFDM